MTTDARSGGGIQIPIEQSSIFHLGSPERADREHADEDGERQYIYSRFGNPTVDNLAKALAILEGGSDAVVTSSGNAAAMTALSMALDEKPGPIVTHRGLYGGTVELLHIFERVYGVPVVWADPDDSVAWGQAISSASTVFVETPSNPLWKVVDLRSTAATAEKAEATLIVDNTVATPFNQRPLQFGADFVVHSTSKFLNGHSDAIGGAVVSKRELTARQRSIHQNLGATVNAIDAWLILRGMRTFSVRMEAHNRNGQMLANWLLSHSAVLRVYYPGYESESAGEICIRQMRHPGSMLSFELRGGEDAARRFLGNLNLVVHGVSLGGMETLAVQPAATTHRGMSRADLSAAGIAESLIRLSVGIESLDDLMADLDAGMSS